MTHAIKALKNYNDKIELIEGHLYLIGEKSYKELNIKSLIDQKIVVELTEDEALEFYKNNKV